MCFSPKIKTPAPKVENIVDPAPLSDEPKGVVFGADEDGSEEGTEVSGRKDLKVEKETSGSDGTTSSTPKASQGDKATSKTQKANTGTAKSSVSKAMAKKGVK